MKVASPLSEKSLQRSQNSNLNYEHEERREKVDNESTFGLKATAVVASEPTVTEQGTPLKHVEAADKRSSSAEPGQQAPVHEGQDNAAGDRISCTLCSRSYKHQRHVNEHMREKHPDAWE